VTSGGGSTKPALAISVLVPTFRRPDRLHACLDGLVRQTLSAKEVLVVVRDTDVRTRDAVADRHDLPLREVVVGRPGLVAARNAGLAAATGDVVAFIDDDAVARPDWLARLAAHYDDPLVGAVGGRDQIHHGATPVTGPLFDRVGVLTWYGRFISMHHLGHGAPRKVDFLKGVNMSFDRRAHPSVRVDEHLRGNGAQVHEETSVCLQLRRLGKRVIYDPGIVVDHYEAERGAADERDTGLFVVRRDRSHNQAFVVVRYYPMLRAVTHLVYAMAIGMADSPGVALTLRNMVRRRRLRGHLVPLLANVVGRCAGTATALRARNAQTVPSHSART
jgi:glycosyltransferase involved in cell wall biosynthesis